MFGLFNKKDPICGMKEQKGKGEQYNGKWFCSKSCLKKFMTKEASNPHKGCCH